jgi:hypothetical protein
MDGSENDDRRADESVLHAGSDIGETEGFEALRAGPKCAAPIAAALAICWKHGPPMPNCRPPNHALLRHPLVRSG